MPSRDYRSAIFLTAVASLIWGTSFPGTKWGLGYVGNDILFLWMRFLFATAVTLAIVLYLKRFSFSLLRDPLIWLMGGLNACGFILQYVGLTITTASKTALLVDINVIAVAIISYFAFRERLSKVQASGVFIGMVGIFLVTFDRSLSFAEGEILGDILVYLAGWSWAFFIVLGKKMLDKHSAVEVSSGSIVTCMVWLTLPVVFLASRGMDITIEPMAWGAIAYLGVMCTSVAILLWAMGLEGVSATASATIMLIEVVTALAISFVFLEETLRTVAVVGAAFVLVSIFLVSYSASPIEKPIVKSA